MTALGVTLWMLVLYWAWHPEKFGEHLGRTAKGFYKGLQPKPPKTGGSRDY
jgi:hypothetical protein